VYNVFTQPKSNSSMSAMIFNVLQRMLRLSDAVAHVELTPKRIDVQEVSSPRRLCEPFPFLIVFTSCSSLTKADSSAVLFVHQATLLCVEIAGWAASDYFLELEPLIEGKTSSESSYDSRAGDLGDDRVGDGDINALRFYRLSVS